MDLPSTAVALDDLQMPAIASSDPVREHILNAWREAFGNKGTAGASIIDLRTGAGRVYRLLAEIKRLTGFTVPLATVFQAGTVDGLTEIVTTGVLPPFEPLIRLQDGTEAPPVFILPGLGGSVFQLFDFAKLLRYPGSVTINQQAGLDGRDPPHDTVPAMVAFQLANIRAVQPEGPFALIGYSFGGIIALEIARQEAAAGRPVPFLAMIEPGLPETAWPAIVRARFLLRRVRHHVSKLRALSAREAMGYVSGHSGALIGRVGRLLGTSGGGWSPYRSEGQPDDLNAVREGNLVAVYAYLPTQYTGHLTLFKSEHGDPLSCDPLEVWPRYLPSLDIVEVPGAHETMLRGRHVQNLAEKVGERLRRAVSPG